jgi:N-hydroxyarylamine O-acetyltransferase
LACLEALHLAHATHIPFENLDIQLGLPIRLDLEALEDKLVRRRRGGYCFEHNTLFAAVLERLGFHLETLEARVRFGAKELSSRSHMTLRVKLPEGDFLADVGFGGEGLLGPAAMDGSECRRFGEVHRVVPEGRRQVLQTLKSTGWMDLYAIEPEPVFPVDYLVGNHYTSTYPESRFVKTLTAQLPTPGARHVLRNRTYTVQRGEAVEVRDLAGPEELLDLLRKIFGLAFPPGTRFRNPEF